MPTYLQLVHQVEHALRLGSLEPGDQLPKVKDVVASLAINPNTVPKAYRELETKGLTAGRPGQGTFIEATLSQVALPELIGLRRSLLGWLATADRRAGRGWIVALFTSVLRDFRERLVARGPPWRGGRRLCGRGVNVIEASGLDKRYGSTWALRDCTLAIPEGHVVALVGPNGAGKTTLLNLAVGLTAPTAGRSPCSEALRPAHRRTRRHRLRGPGYAALQEPVRRRHAAPDPEPEPSFDQATPRPD